MASPAPTPSTIPRARLRARRLWRRSRYLAGKLTLVRGADWRYLAEGQAALLWAQALVWLRPQGELTGTRGHAGADTPARAEPTPARLALGRRLALGVTRAAAYGVFRPLCLVRAVALNALLERHGILGSEVRVGVKRVAGKFEAHAWVVYAGEVLGDQEGHVRGFAELEDLRMLGRRP